MIAKHVSEIIKDDIDGLVKSSTSEGRTLEFKQQLPGNSDQDRKEFLADISSFANSAGGDLLFGVIEEKSVATDARGIAIRDADAEIRRLDEMIRGGIEPRIPGIQIRPVDGFPEGAVLVIRVPRSWASPHMVCFKGSSRFFARNNKGKYQLDVAEIRALFTLSESVPERIREFRVDRLARINAGEMPAKLIDGPKVVLHIVPLSAFSNPTALSPTDLRAQRSHFSPLGGLGGYFRYNMDGLLALTSEDSACRAYCQTYRSGIIETVDAKMMSRGNDRKVIPSTTFEESLLLSAGQYVKALANLEIAPPYVVLLSLLGFEGYAMAVSPGSWDGTNSTIDRDVVALPDVLVDDVSRPTHEIMRPVIDMAWNAAGRERSPNFDDNSNWNAR